MNNIKTIVAKNITELRKMKGITQLELAEQLNYSDKAVSKWERAESMPDISVLVDIADLFGVPLDYLVREEHTKKELLPEKEKEPKYRKSSIAAVSILLVWLIAMLVFVVIMLASEKPTYQWLTFVYAVPVSMIVWLVFNSVWFCPRRNYLIISLLMWSGLASLHLSLLPFGKQIGLIYLLGIPGQIIIAVWAMIRKPEKEILPSVEQ